MDERTARPYARRSPGARLDVLSPQQQSAERSGAYAAAELRYCVKCFSLFYCPSGKTGAGRCTYDNGLHNLAGSEFYLPNLEEGAAPSTGQPDWRYCDKCNGLCYAPNKVPTGSCPAGGTHNPVGWTFVLPNNMQGATTATGQADWRYCAYCKGLFFDGYVHKGACPAAPGGGLRLTPVLESGTPESGRFYPFRG